MNPTMWLAAVVWLVTPLALAAQTPDSAAVKPGTVHPDSGPEAADSAPAKPLTISGFVTASYTYGVHHTGQTLVGRFYDRFHNQFEINAAKLVVEKTVATDQVDAVGARPDPAGGPVRPLQPRGLRQPGYPQEGSVLVRAGRVIFVLNRRCADFPAPGGAA